MSASLRRVRVDPRLCEGHALGIDLAPEVFDLDACPRGAISVVSEQHSSNDRTGRTAAA